jgi:hypothetical protein
VIVAVGRMPVGDGSDAFVEVQVDSSDLGESVQLAAVTDTVLMLPFTLASSIDGILPALSLMLNKLKACRPSELELQLGLTVGGESGLIFAKGSAEATFTVKMTWRDTAAAPTPDLPIRS